MIDKKIEEAINDQINFELYSAYIYLAMAAYFESINLKGFGSWMRIQSMEEMTHARRFYAYIVERGGRVVLKDIKAPQKEWKSPLEVFENAYAHEQIVTKRINEIASLANDKKDFATIAMLQFFINEQVEEEASADEVIQSLKLVDNQPSGWFLLDKDLAARTFIPPVGVTI